MYAAMFLDLCTPSSRNIATRTRALAILCRMGINVSQRRREGVAWAHEAPGSIYGCNILSIVVVSIGAVPRHGWKAMVHIAPFNIPHWIISASDACWVEIVANVLRQQDSQAFSRGGSVCGWA